MINNTKLISSGLKKILIVIVATYLFAACNNQTLDSKIANQQITKTNLSTISEEMQTSASDEDIEYFVNAITRLGNTPDSIIGKSVQQIIDEQKKHYRNELEKTLVGTGTRISLFLNHQFKYHGIRFLDEDPKQPINDIVFEITNIADKDIKRIEGNLSYYDNNGRIIRIFQLATGNTISPVTKDDKAMIFSMKFNHNIKTDDTLIRTNPDLRAIWTPTMIEFTDGQVLKDMTLNN